MEDKYSRISGKDVLNSAEKEIDRKQHGIINDDNVYMFEEDYFYDEDTKIVVNDIEQLKSYVVNRVDNINSYVGDFIKEKSLIGVFKTIYRFSIDSSFNDYDQDIINELIDYIYDNCVYPPDKADEIAYLEITSERKHR